MKHIQVILVLCIGCLKSFGAEPELWNGNKFTPEQPFPAKVRAVRVGWEGDYLLLEEIGGTEKRLCTVFIRPLEYISYGIVRDTKSEEDAEELRKQDGWIFISPGIEVDGFSWSMGLHTLGRRFGQEDILTKTFERFNKKRIQQAEQAGTGQPATRPESKSESSQKPQPEAEGRSR
jgi:hypothetical protein